MRPLIAGLLLVVLTTGALGAERASAQQTSFQEFSDWYFSYCGGQRALGYGDLETASRRFREAIKLAWPSVSSDPRPLARTYTDFALVLLLQGRPFEAEPLAQWALKVREERFGKQSEQVATTLHVLTQLASAQLRYAQAESYLTRAITIWEHRLGSDHPQMVIGLCDLAALYSLQRKYAQAERVYQRVLDMPGTALPAIHPYRVISLIGLASTYTALGQLDRAESTNVTLIALIDRMSPAGYPEIAPSLDAYISQLQKLGRTSDAEALEAIARSVRAGRTVVRPLPADPRRPRPRPGPRST
jgi:tetratricopeptide (TPR) repeat protein